MEWQRHREAAPGKRTLASARGCSRAHSLEGLEPKAPSTSCMYLLHHQRVDIQMASGCLLPSTSTPPILSRTRRAHFRLSWAERLKRNVRPATEGQVKITLFGVPDHFADFLGLRAA